MAAIDAETGAPPQYACRTMMESIESAHLDAIDWQARRDRAPCECGNDPHARM
jgi:hypothetical protein